MLPRSIAALFSAVVITLSAPALASAQVERPFNVHELIAMDRIGDPQVAPDGEWVAFVVSSLDREANRRRSDLWLVRTDGSGLRRLTTHEAGDFNPRWSATAAKPSR
jgi:dipeptidyl aminopeptidase/acylaminoacyl peptidase